MDCSMPGLPVHHQLPEFTQTYVHQVGDAIQLSHISIFLSPSDSDIETATIWVLLLQLWELAKIDNNIYNNLI